MEAIQRAQILKEELDSLRPISKENELRIMQKFRLDWNYHSNNLEGNSLTYGETKALILFGITAQGKPFKDHLEMTGHNEAVEWIEELVKEERPLTQAFVRELHTLLLKEPYQVDAITPTGEPNKKWVTVGDYKKTPNHVKTKTGEMFWFATPEETPAKMTDLIDWFRSEREKVDYDAIVTAIQFHYRFIRIHPFDDGNGRTARILMNFVLMQGGYPPVIIKTGEKQEYIATLEQADAGLFEPYVNYIADNLCKSLELMIQGAKGESVEEYDDIDKEIALLELKLQRGGKRVEKIRSNETINEFAETVLQRVFDCSIETAFSFKKYFREFGISVGFSPDQYFINVDTKQDIINHILELFKSQANKHQISLFRLSVHLNELKYLSLENEKIIFPLQIDFLHSSVVISTRKYRKTLLYTDKLDDIEFKILAKDIKEDGVEQINAVIKQKEDNQ